MLKNLKNLPLEFGAFDVMRREDTGILLTSAGGKGIYMRSEKGQHLSVKIQIAVRIST